MLEADRLVWVGDAEIRESQVSDLREAVVLARSWSLETEGAGLGWVPALPPAPRSERSWVLEDLDWGRQPGKVFAVADMRVDYRIWGGLTVATTSRVRTETGLHLGTIAQDRELGVPYRSDVAVALRGSVGVNLLPAQAIVAPGVGWMSVHALAKSDWLGLPIARVELGHQGPKASAIATLSAPLHRFVGQEASEPSGQRLDLLYRRGASVRWQVGTGLERRHRDVSGPRVGFSMSGGLAIDLGAS